MEEYRGDEMKKEKTKKNETTRRGSQTSLDASVLLFAPFPLLSALNSGERRSNSKAINHNSVTYY